MMIVAVAYGALLSFWHRKLMVWLHQSHPDIWQRLGREDVTGALWQWSLRFPLWSWGSIFFFLAKRYERLGIPEFSRQASRFRLAFFGWLFFLAVTSAAAFWASTAPTA